MAPGGAPLTQTITLAVPGAALTQTATLRISPLRASLAARLAPGMGSAVALGVGVPFLLTLAGRVGAPLPILSVPAELCLSYRGLVPAGGTVRVAAYDPITGDLVGLPTTLDRKRGLACAQVMHPGAVQLVVQVPASQASKIVAAWAGAEAARLVLATGKPSAALRSRAQAVAATVQRIVARHALTTTTPAAFVVPPLARPGNIFVAGLAGGSSGEAFAIAISFPHDPAAAHRGVTAAGGYGLAAFVLRRPAVAPGPREQRLPATVRMSLTDRGGKVELITVHLMVVVPARSSNEHK